MDNENSVSLVAAVIINLQCWFKFLCYISARSYRGLVVLLSLVLFPVYCCC